MYYILIHIYELYYYFYVLLYICVFTYLVPTSSAFALMWPLLHTDFIDEKGSLDLLPQNADIMGMMSVLFVNKKGFCFPWLLKKGLIVSDDTP